MQPRVFAAPLLLRDDIVSPRARDGGASVKVGGGGMQSSAGGASLYGGSGGILPQKMLKSRVSEMVFSVFSMRNFFKKIPWISVKCQVPFAVTAIF